MSSSDGFFKQEDSTQHPLEVAYAGLETEEKSPAPTASDDLHPGLVPASENESDVGKESFYPGICIHNKYNALCLELVIDLNCLLSCCDLGL